MAGTKGQKKRFWSDDERKSGHGKMLFRQGSDENGVVDAESKCGTRDRLFKPAAPR